MKMKLMYHISTLTQKKIRSGSLINKLRLNVAQQCNMRCTYCYIDHDSALPVMKWDIAKKAIDEFSQNLIRNKRNSGLIRFFGGEPLLNWKVIYRSIEYSKEQYKDLEFEYLINTNGVLVDSDKAKYFKNNNINLAVSLDGISEVNDAHRVFHKGEGTFFQIDRAIDILLREACSIGIEVTLNDTNYKTLLTVVDYIKEKQDRFGIRISLGLQSTCMVPKTGLDTFDADRKSEYLLEALKYGREKGVYMNAGMVFFPWNTFMGNRRLGAYCGAIGGEISVNPNGDIYPCSALDKKLGSVNNLQEIFTSQNYIEVANRTAGNLLSCSGCDIEAFCSGGCAADSQILLGDMYEPTVNCSIERAVFKSMALDYLSFN